MRQIRKEALMHSFPGVPDKFIKQMQGKGAANFAVMLTYGDELYVRCYHRYHKGELVERQRYVFAKDGCCRYGSEYGNKWAIRREFREPVFCAPNYNFTFDNSYSVINIEAIKQSCMRYSHAEKYNNSLLMQYMKLYCKHPNVEYIVKSGYSHLISEVWTGYWGNQKVMRIDDHINFKSNNLLKMLGLNRTEFKLLKGKEGYYENYMTWRDKYPKYKPEELLSLAKVYRWEIGTCDRFAEITGVRPTRLAQYLDTNDIYCRDYSDYLDQCRILKYNLHDTAICMPHDFKAMHTRLSSIIKYKQDETTHKQFTDNIEDRKKLEYSSGNLFIRQPLSMDEIAAEGATLDHCVGGYAERHAKGVLHILFIRNTDKPDVPYYTMELGIHGHIQQVRGRKNCEMTDEVKAFVEEYKLYIAKIFSKKERKSA